MTSIEAWEICLCEKDISQSEVHYVVLGIMIFIGEKG